MSREPLRIMVDTNVWVDSYCPDHSESDASRAFLTESMKEEAQLFFPVHIAKDVLYIIRHELKRAILSETGSIDGETSRAISQISLAFVKNMTESATPVGADASDLWLAEKYLSLHGDYEDNLVLAACKRIDADFLVTNDRRLLEHADIAAKTPRQMMTILSLR